MAVLEARQKEADRANARPPGQLCNPGGGPPYRRDFGAPEGKVQFNFTDSESRIKTSQHGFQQCCDIQLAVDAKHQLIAYRHATIEANDRRRLIPVLDGVEAAYGVRPETVLAAARYCAEASLTELEKHGITGYVALGREGKKQLAVDPGKRPAATRI